MTALAICHIQMNGTSTRTENGNVWTIMSRLSTNASMIVIICLARIVVNEKTFRLQIKVTRSNKR